MCYWIKLSLLLAFCVHGAVHATKLSDREYQRFTDDGPRLLEKDINPRARGNFYINIIKGLFNSDKGNLIQNFADIPCDTIQTLESNVDEAEQFVSQIQAGEVPSLITNLPDEAISGFADIIDVATMITDVAEAAVTDVVSLFNNIEEGSIENVATDLVNAITSGWDDFSAGIESGWDEFTCWINDDCSSLAGFCDMPATAIATTTENADAASSSTAVAAAYTSAFYVSESSAATAGGEPYSMGSAATTASDISTTVGTATAPETTANTDGATQQSTTPTAPQNPAPGPVQSNSRTASLPTQSPQATPLTQPANKGNQSFKISRANILALAAFIVFALAVSL